MTYPTPLNDLLAQAALYGIPVFLGLVIAIIMFKRGTCWLAFLSGIAVQFCLNFVQVRYFLFFGYTEVCAKIIALSVRHISIGTAILTLIRIIYRLVHKDKIQEAEANVPEDNSEEEHPPVAEEIVPPARLDGKNWICPKCGKKNNPVLIRCPKCTTPRVFPDDPPVVRQKPVSDHERAPQPVHQGSQQTQHMTPAQLREPEQELKEITTRWVCPKCGLVHSKDLPVCFHCGTPQTSANKFIQ